LAVPRCGCLEIVAFFRQLAESYITVKQVAQGRGAVLVGVGPALEFLQRLLVTAQCRLAVRQPQVGVAEFAKGHGQFALGLDAGRVGIDQALESRPSVLETVQRYPAVP
jgi:hypothetical protein